MKSIFLFLPLFLTHFSFTLQLFSQNTINVFGVEDGLAQSTVQQILQDKDGYLWFATMSGSSRYDGRQFTTFSTENGLAENNITAMCADASGNIWFGHWAGGISRYLIKEKKINKIMNGFPLKSVTKLRVDKNNLLWIGTTENAAIAVAIGEMQGDTLPKPRFNLLGYSGFDAKNVYDILHDKRGALWFATDSGLYYFFQETFTRISVENGLPDNFITALFEDFAGNIWIGLRNAGAMRYSPEKNDGGSEFEMAKEFQKNSTAYSEKNGLAHRHINCFTQTDDKNIWLGTQGGGLFTFNALADEQKQHTNLFRTLNSSQGLTNDKILSLYQDRENNLWIGTYVGLNQRSAGQFELFGSQEGLPNTLVWDILQSQNGSFWLASDGGLIQMNLSQNKISSIVLYSKKDGLIAENITSVCEDGKGNIWTNSWSAGINKIDYRNKKIQTFNTKEKTLPTNEIWCMEKDPDGNIWFGTNQFGALKYNLLKNTFETFTTENGLGGNSIYCIFRDNKNLLWFLALDGKISRYDGKQFELFPQNEISKNIPISIAEDISGNIWIGTYSGIIYKYDGRQFFEQSIPGRKSTDTPYMLTFDKNNNMWIGGNYGIAKYNPANNSYEKYSKDDGFPGIEINPNAVCTDNHGNLWLGTILGAVIHYGGENRMNTQQPLVHIEKIKAFFKDTVLEQNTSLNHTLNHLTFQFIGISATNPKKVKYKYFLKGLDADWSEPISENYITYPQIPPGKYTFMVKAANSDGFWSEHPASFSFEITPVFWQRKSFYATIVILALGIIYLFVRIRLNIIKREKQIMEQQIKLRTSEIVNQKNEIEKINQELEKLSVVAKEIANAIIITDRNGNIEWVNETFTGLTGLTLKHLKENFENKILKISGNPQLKECMENAVATKAPVHYEAKNIIMDGKETWMATTLTPVVNKNGEIKKFIFIDTDITERKKMEEAMKDKNDKLWRMGGQMMTTKQELEQKNILIERKNKDIFDSISYAKKIQQAIIPEEEVIKRGFPESFVLFLPRDIVSGDFYWFNQKENSFFLAAADCTGHGVPGALISMIGIELLNNIINEKNIYEPAEILTQLNIGIIAALKQDNADAAKDGMDVALISYNNQIKELIFSGAKRPLIRYSKRNNQLIEIKGNKFPIGGFENYGKRTFMQEKINYDSGDTIYFFSDGFGDQFGGPRLKKFKYKRFKGILSAIQNLSMQQQKITIERALTAWKGTNPQTDDILIIGIKLE